MLERIVSGLQTGADFGAIRAAKDLGFKTGGVMPFGFKTQDGYKPEYAELYGATEHESSSYFPRTYQNVRDSDGTIRLAVDLFSTGENCTLKAIEQYKKPYFDVKIESLSKFSIPIEIHPATASKWIISHNIRILNVAGNAEAKHPGMENWVYRYISAMLKALNSCK